MDNFDIYNTRIFNSKPNPLSGEEYMMEFISTGEAIEGIGSHMVTVFPSARTLADQFVTMRKFRVKEKIHLIVIRDVRYERNTAKGYMVVFSDGKFTNGRCVCAPVVQAAIKIAASETELHFA